MNHEVRGHEDARRHGGGGLYAHQSRAPGWGDLPSGPSCVTPSPHLTVSASSSSSLVIPHPHLPSKPVLSRARAARPCTSHPGCSAVEWTSYSSCENRSYCTWLFRAKTMWFLPYVDPTRNSETTAYRLSASWTVCPLFWAGSGPALFAPVIPGWSPTIKLGMAGV